MILTHLVFYTFFEGAIDNTEIPTRYVGRVGLSDVNRVSVKVQKKQ